MNAVDNYMLQVSKDDPHYEDKKAALKAMFPFNKYSQALNAAPTFSIVPYPWYKRVWDKTKALLASSYGRRKR